MTNSGVCDEASAARQEEEVIELREEFMVLAVPTEAVEITINARIYHDGELTDVVKTMELSDIREAFQDAQRNYMPEDAVFSLTPLGEAALERLRSKGREGEET